MLHGMDGLQPHVEKPLVIFYPTVSMNDQQFPLNKTVQEWHFDYEKRRSLFMGQTENVPEAPRRHWRGDLVVAKCLDEPRADLTDATAADVAILRTILATVQLPEG